MPIPMTQIHPTAVVDPHAAIDPSVEVGPYCVIGRDVRIGAGTRLVAHVTILGHTEIGRDNTIWPQAVLGGEPQDLKYHGEASRLIVGDNNDIREQVTMHVGTANGGWETRVGSDNMIMVGAHVAHDCRVGDHVLIANAVQLAGHVVVEDHAVVAGASAVHHFTTIGRHAYVAGMTRVVRDVPPFMLFEGDPGRVRSVNVIGLQRHGFEEDAIRRLKDAYRRLYRQGNGAPRRDAADAPCSTPDCQDQAHAPAREVEGQRNSVTVLDELIGEYPDDECIGLLVGFIRRTMVGTFGRYREGERVDDRRATAPK